MWIAKRIVMGRDLMLPWQPNVLRVAFAWSSTISFDKEKLSFSSNVLDNYKNWISGSELMALCQGRRKQYDVIRFDSMTSLCSTAAPRLSYQPKQRQISLAQLQSYSLTYFFLARKDSNSFVIALSSWVFDCVCTKPGLGRSVAPISNVRC